MKPAGGPLSGFLPRLCIWLFLLSASIPAYVILDTSAEPEVRVDSIVSAKPISRTDSTGLIGKRPHFGNVLFLSADNKFVYAYIGVLKALEEYGLDIDLVLTESKSALIGISWALGYSAGSMEERFLKTPIESFLKPFQDPENLEMQNYPQNFTSSAQWKIPLRLPGPDQHSREFLHLSWMIAKITHDAPAGPVEDLAATPKPLAMQIADLTHSESSVVMEGNLQNLLKGALFPTDILRKRQNLWPNASGAILSGHKVLADRLPFTFDRMIVIQSSSNLIPPSLDEVPVSWLDSITKQPLQNPNLLGRNDPLAENIIAIELVPESGFNPQESDSKKWIELGYLSTLRTMDVLKTVLSAGPLVEPAPGASLPTSHQSKLGLNRVSLNPLASGGRQFLLDIVRTSEEEDSDSSADGSIAAIIRSGFYSDLDLEWTRAIGEERASLIFDTKEHSRIQFKAGLNAVFSQVNITDRSPEVYSGLTWDEPFYIPFRTEVGALLGGHRPGYEFRAMITPIYPLRLDLGISATHLEIYYPHASSAVPDLNPFSLRMQRDLQEVFLKIYPASCAYLRTSVQKHEMSIPNGWSPGEPSFLSTDFQETAFLGLGNKKPTGVFPSSVWLRYRNLNRINLIGEIRPAVSSLEARINLGLGDFSVSEQYYWSNQKIRGFNLYDLIESGRIDAFSFQDEYLFGALRSPHFQNLNFCYSPFYKKVGLRLAGGIYRKFGQPVFSFEPITETSTRSVRYHWEMQGGYQTALGLLKAGIGGLEGEGPFYFLKIGSDLSLGFGEMN